MKQFTIEEVFSAAWEKTQKHGIIYALVFLVMMLLGVGMNVILGGASSFRGSLGSFAEAGSSLAISVLTLLVQILVMPTIYAAMLRQMRGDKTTVSAKDAPNSLAFYVQYFLLNLCSSLLTGIGYFCCILPGFYLQVRLAFAPYFLLENREESFLTAIEKSWKMTAQNTWTYVGVAFLSILAGLAGFILCYLPGFFTICIPLFASAYLYNKNVGTPMNDQDAYTKWYGQ